MEYLTEKQYPYLKYLQWNGRIYDNPEVVRKLRKLSNRHQTALITEYLIGIDVADEKRRDAEHALRKLNDSWPNLAPKFRDTVDLLSREFTEAVLLSQEALMQGNTEAEFFRGRTFSGTILTPFFKTTTSYNIECDELGNRTRLDILMTDYMGAILVFLSNGTAFVSDSFKLVDTRTKKVELELGGTDFDKRLAAIEYVSMFVRSYLMFCRFAEVRTKYIPKDGTREARKSATDMVSTSSLPVRRMYADYFTNIIRTEGFGVRGHFRMQPCGTGHNDRKLIYIKPFQKNGYHRKAKLLKDNIL